MFSKAFRTAVAGALAALMLWGFSPTHARLSLPTSLTLRSAASLPPTVEHAASPGLVVVYSQPPSPSGGILLSSLRDPEGSDTDQWAWDGFRFAWTQPITEIRWRGGYDPARLGSGGPVFDFTVSIYPSSANDTQPDIAHPPLVRYEVGSNAEETPADVLAGVQTYVYRYTLPAPFDAAAGTKYWVQIEAFQSGNPDWGLSAGTDGDGHYFRRIPGLGPTYQIVSGDAAFTLMAPGLEGHRLYLPIVLRDVSAAEAARRR